MHIAIFLLVSLMLLILFSGFYVFWVGCARRKELPWLDEAIKKTPYGKYYAAIRAADQFLQNNGAQDVWIKSHDGLKLHAHWIPAEEPAGTILLAHGYRSTKLVDFSMVYQLYHQMGLNLLVPDQRSHGRSEGRFITFGVKESRDMEGWIRWHNRRWPDQKIVLSGLSMGASTMLYLADRQLPSNVKGIIADCGFTSPWEILSSVFRNVTHLPPFLSICAANLFATVLAGFNLKQCDTRKILPNSRLPVLMVHGTGDDFVPCEMTKEAYSVCTEPKTLMLVEGAGHGVSFLAEPDRYIATVNDFLFACLGVHL